VIFDGKVPSKQNEILSSCGKGQRQHMERKKSEKNEMFCFVNFLEVSVFSLLTVMDNLPFFKGP
jgi:hypothetical protein